MMASSGSSQHAPVAIMTDLSLKVQRLCQRNLTCSDALATYCNKEWTPASRRKCLRDLAILLLDGSCRCQIALAFQPIILELICRCAGYVKGKAKREQYFIIALADILPLCPQISKFVCDYLQKNALSLQASSDARLQLASKASTDGTDEVTELVRAVWLLTERGHVTGLPLIQWTKLLLPCLATSFPHTHLQWYAALFVSRVLNLQACERNTLFKHYFSEQEIADLTVRDDISSKTVLKICPTEATTTQERVIVGAAATATTQPAHGTVRHDSLLTSHIHPDLVSLSNNLITCEKLEKEDEQVTSGLADDLVLVPSTWTHIDQLSQAILSQHAVLIKGPVGCGKTALIQWVAKQTGHRPICIQLGEQTDSKSLIGYYCCTELPGQFVWNPGLLTRAVMDGLWVVFEDLDHAPMDVHSLLVSLLERRSLSVPGRGVLHAAPGFHMFATQRLLRSVLGWQQSTTLRDVSMFLSRSWRCLNMKLMDQEQLNTVLTTRFPELSAYVSKLIDIYMMLSGSDYDDDLVTPNEDVKQLMHNGMKVMTMRCLMRWCARIDSSFGENFETPAEPGTVIFLELLHCFCMSVSSPRHRLLLAHTIAAKLNLTKASVEFYLHTYKPDVTITEDRFIVGRSYLPKQSLPYRHAKRHQQVFAFTRQSSCLLESLAACVNHCEPVLLVGETGTGKTAVIQYLAQQTGHDLCVINMNQQTDSADLLGGYKPLSVRHIVQPFVERFELLFIETFSQSQNMTFLQHIQTCVNKEHWQTLFSLLQHSQKAALTKIKDADLRKKWTELGERLVKLKTELCHTESELLFKFIQGALVRAVHAGVWVLLDEINLASDETLDCLTELLEAGIESTLSPLVEDGDAGPLKVHRDFRIFASMNPATDVGKKDLPLGIVNRFTVFYVDELSSVTELSVLVSHYLRAMTVQPSVIQNIIKFYLDIRALAELTLTDSNGHRPFYSLRTLCRALSYVAADPCRSIMRSLYEGLCLSFLSQLDRASYPIVVQLIKKHVFSRTNLTSLLKQPLPAPPLSSGPHVSIQGYWIAQGTLQPYVQPEYILTATVKANLTDLARIASAGGQPVLLQGNTSVGKTSLITWLANATGNTCIRINNHQHTDLQEYLGSYGVDQTGKLSFQEGVLVQAMRKGNWVILDELNLAPTDVLEALNRLLDDNHELFIPETQELVQAHPRFMLFATQNPPGQYAGRKMLSRAFRNRFIELHFDDIPKEEVQIILHQRCAIPQSCANRLVAVMSDLQLRRRESGVFAGRHGYMTLRDLFRWANRYHCPEELGITDWNQYMADQGYMLLAGRVRQPREGVIICEVLEKHLRRRVDCQSLFTLSENVSTTTQYVLRQLVESSLSESGSAGSTDAISVNHQHEFDHIVWTYSLRRMALLMAFALMFKEPVLLVGETGCGKTSLCQLYSALKHLPLLSVNCHMHSESADFLGSLRPIRDRQQLAENESVRLFEWVDGPLVVAMKTGGLFLVDEISLADDSVIERLNSVLERERTLLLAEKGGTAAEHHISADDAFQFVATMNPAGDYGKKELSPALRNRVTEIWCPQVSDRVDLTAIIQHNLLPHIASGAGFNVADVMLDFTDWLVWQSFGKRLTVSIRDLLTWVEFMNRCVFGASTSADETVSCLKTSEAYLHGACLVFVDALGAGNTEQSTDKQVHEVRWSCIRYLSSQLKLDMSDEMMVNMRLVVAETTEDSSTPASSCVHVSENRFHIPPFSIEKGKDNAGSRSDVLYELRAATPCMNAQRILRALQLHQRPILLEGAPGVGKTSLVLALARAACRNIVRINLSEQTDVSDLFGADLPVEGAGSARFAWRDGPFLAALKAGHWILLDELNLASQSVLEGLNACLDHRGSVFIPELARTFYIQKATTRIFACQNPLKQGSGRKGLPRSLLNRFTQVYIEPLLASDLLFICKTLYTSIPEDILIKMIDFNMQIEQAVMVDFAWGQRGRPWEFNLRDVLRWCQLIVTNQVASCLNPGQFAGLIYGERMRTEKDKKQVAHLYNTVFGPVYPLCSPVCGLRITEDYVQVGEAFLKVCLRRPMLDDIMVHQQEDLQMLHHDLSTLESLIHCVNMNWMTILVGPACSGKTSCVQLLASLSGHKLHVLPVTSSMDTIDLLGGFEQTDVLRHLKPVEDVVYESIMEYTKNALLSGSTARDISMTTKLLTYWDKYQDLVNQGGDMSDDKVLKPAITALQKIILELSTDATYSPEKMSDCRKRLSNLDICVSSPAGGRLAKGGSFEWTDSLLVETLQSGDWLLIDNVNLCSASVLDRLNAVLEPNGVLCLNERGLVNGKMPTVKPHPDFRLFMAMDPTHGQISRAMRNRGIEIYMLGENESFPYSNVDLHLLLRQSKLHYKTARDWLMAIHQAVRDAVIGSDRPSVSDLLTVASMVREQQAQGISLIVAMINSCTRVYLEDCKMPSNKQLISNIIGSYTDTLNMMELAMADTSLHDLPSLCDYRHSPELATVSLHSAALIDSLQHLSLYDVHARSLQYELCIFLEQCSITGHNYAVRFLHEKLLPSDGEAGERSSSVSTMLSHINTLMSSVFSSKPLQMLLDLYTSLSTQCQTDMSWLRSEPADLRWNMPVVRELNRLCTKQCGTDATCDWVLKMTDATNRLMFLTRVLMSEWLKIDDKQSGLLKISHDHCHNYISASTAASEATTAALHTHLWPFFVQLRKDLRKQTCFSSPDMISDSHLTQVFDGMFWLRCFYDACVNDGCSPAVDVHMSILKMHWQWICKKSLKAFYGHNLQRASMKLRVTIESLNGQLTSASDHQGIIANRLRRIWGHGPEWTTEHEINQARYLLTVARAGITDNLTVGHIHLWSNDQRRQFLQSYSDLYDSVKSKRIHTDEPMDEDDVTQTNASEAKRQLAQILDHFNISVSLTSHDRTEAHFKPVLHNLTENMVSVTATDQCSVRLWPLVKLIHMHAEQDIISAAVSLAHSNDPDEHTLQAFTVQHVQAVIRFCTEHGRTSPHHLCLFRMLLSMLLTQQEHTQLLAQLLLSNHDELWSLKSSHYVLNDDSDMIGHVPFLQADKVPGTQQDPSHAGTSLMGVGVMELSPVSCLLFSMLCSSSDSENRLMMTWPSSSRWPAPAVSLHSVHEQHDLLIHVKRHLWINSSILTSPQYQFRYTEVVKVGSVFVHLLSTLTSLLDIDIRDTWTSVVRSLKQSSIHDELPQTEEYLHQCSQICKDHLSNTLENRLVALLLQCISSFHDLLRRCDDWLLLSKCWVYVGILHTHLLAPIAAVDAVQKSMVKLDHINRELTDISLELECRQKHHYTVTGQSEWDSSSIHPHIHRLTERQSDLLKLQATLQSRQAYRPQTNQYGHLVTEVKAYLLSVGDMENGHVIPLINRLQRYCCQRQQHDNQNGNSGQNAGMKRVKQEKHVPICIREEKSWQITQEHFISRMRTEYLPYRDLWEGFLVGVQQIRHGMRLAAQRAMTLYQQKKSMATLVRSHPHQDVLAEITASDWTSTLLCTLSRFPTISVKHCDLHQLSMALTSDLNLHSIHSMLSGSDQSTAVSRLLQIGLSWLRLHVQYSRHVDSSELTTLSHIVHMVLMMWREKHERQKETEEASASLYKMKVTSHGDDATEEETEEKEFHAYFPTYHEEFLDVTYQNSLDDATVIKQSPHIEESELVLNAVAMTTCTIQQQLISSHTICDWILPSAKHAGIDDRRRDYQDPLIASYQLSGCLVQDNSCYMAGDLDRELLGSHMVTCSVLQGQLSGLVTPTAVSDETKKVSQSKVDPDFYHGSNLPEVCKCRPLLEELATRVKQLQTEWPDHPALKQTLVVVYRVLDFNATSPVVRFLTGLELVLQKAQDWESIAAKHVSLSSHLNSISELIVQWRKLELGCWKQSLFSEEEKVREKTTVWWCHLFQLIEEYTSQEEQVAASQDSEMLQSLKQFMEKSTLGEFSIRLGMLYSFHCRFVISRQLSVPRLSRLAAVLWNMYQFYDQFSATITDQLKKLKAPIERELKSTVKIARWTDMNYWSLRESTGKIRRSIYKHINKYKKVLAMPVESYLSDRLEVSTPTGQASSEWSAHLEAYATSCRETQSIQTKQVLVSTILPQYRHLVPQLCTHVRTVIHCLNYTQLTVHLDEFTGDVIDRSRELEKLQVTTPTDGDKTKQIKEWKQIRLLKQRAIADLFKCLTSIGVSYRKGLVLESGVLDSDALTVPPMDVKVAFTQINTDNRTAIEEIVTGSEMYYYRCVSRRAQLMLALLQPSKELGPANVSRCHGFSDHLFSLLMSQYGHVSDVMMCYKKIRSSTQLMSDLAKGDNQKQLLPPQNMLQNGLVKLMKFLTKLRQVLDQTWHILQSCPKQSSSSDTQLTDLSPLPASELPAVIKMTQESELWQSTVLKLENVTSDADTLYNTLLVINQSAVITWNSYDKLSSGYHQLAETITPMLHELASMFNQTGLCHDSLTYICSEAEETVKESAQITATIQAVHTTSDTADDTCEDAPLAAQVSQEAETLLVTVLMAVQSLLKTHEQQGCNNTESKPGVDQDETDLLSGHLATHLLENVHKDVTMSRIHQVDDHLNKLIVVLVKYSEQASQSDAAHAMIAECAAVLVPYAGLLEFLLIHMIATLRTMAKLLSVLLTIFTQLVTKGFCLPAELSEELSKEGAEQFEDVEAGGLAEGEGVKDVSDQIETEDQLLGQELGERDKKEDADNDEPEIAAEDNAIEMSEDFDGKLHSADPDADREEDSDAGEEKDDVDDRRMGDVDDDTADKLDDRLWGGQDDEKEEQEDQKEEPGAGSAGERSEDLVAKAENTADESKKDDHDKPEQTPETENLDINILQQDEYDENTETQDNTEAAAPPVAEEDLCLPDDLKLDSDMADDENDKQGDAQDEEMGADSKDESMAETESQDEEATGAESSQDEAQTAEAGGDEADEISEREKETSAEDETEDMVCDDDGAEQHSQEIDPDSAEQQDEEMKQDASEAPVSSVDAAALTQDSDAVSGGQSYGSTSQELNSKDETEQVSGSNTTQDQMDVSETSAEMGSMPSTGEDTGQGSYSSAPATNSNISSVSKPEKRKPGQSDERRTLGSQDQRFKRRKTVQSADSEENKKESENNVTADLYEHVMGESGNDERLPQTIDTATAEQEDNQARLTDQALDEEEEEKRDSSSHPALDDKDGYTQVNVGVPELTAHQSADTIKDRLDKKGDKSESVDEDEMGSNQLAGERVLTHGASRGAESSIHTQHDIMNPPQESQLDIEQLRMQFSQELGEWQVDLDPQTINDDSLKFWQQYESQTNHLSQELCEKLRIVLEPTRAIKLRGDYKTGKRLNMRKVIPYIASHFRKDKIWLRRTQPSQRQYQIMLAIDDSASMCDNHSQQMAFKSVAMIANALTLLEVGQLAVCSFGEQVQLIQPFSEPFTQMSGSHVLKQFTFSQKKTRIAQMLDLATVHMLETRTSAPVTHRSALPASQLLLILSDGRGLFMEGMSTVQKAVRRTNDAGIFVVFIIIDNPNNKDSILDIKVPVFHAAGQVPEIKPYLEHFPFPYYIILRGVDSLPGTLSDALFQWFQLVS